MPVTIGNLASVRPITLVPSSWTSEMAYLIAQVLESLFGNLVYGQFLFQGQFSEFFMHTYFSMLSEVSVSRITVFHYVYDH